MSKRERLPNNSSNYHGSPTVKKSRIERQSIGQLVAMKLDEIQGSKLKL